MASTPGPGSERLEQLLGGAQRALRRIVTVELLLGVVVSILFALLLGTVLLVLGVPDRGAMGVALAIAVVWSLAFGLRAIIRWRRMAHRPLSVARCLDRAGRRAQRTGAVALLDAAELRRDRGRFGESEGLGRRAVELALADAEAGELSDLAVREAGRLGRHLTLAAAGLAAANAVLALSHHEAYQRVAGALVSPGGIESVLVPRAPEPRLGDFRIDYRYPDYAGQPPRTVVSATGRVRALPGTEVVLETRARRPMSTGALVIEHGPAPRTPEEAEAMEARRIAVEVEGRRLRARFVIARSGRYRFELVDEAGDRFEERRGHDIVLEADEPPTVRLLEPAESPLEVNERDRVPLVFEAEDDFALGPARVAWRVLGTTREGTVPLTEASVGQQRYAGRGRLDLRSLELKPGDRVAYSVEVFDNDTTNGPKLGASDTKELRIYSKKDHHAKVMAVALEALDALVNLLGDNLERPFEPPGDEAAFVALLDAGDAVAAAAAAAVEKLEKAAAAVKDDPLGRKNVGAAFAQAGQEVQRRAGAMRRTLRMGRGVPERLRPDANTAEALERRQLRLVGTLERQAVYLSDLIDDQRMIDAESLAKDLREQQRALRDALERYKEAPSEEQRRLISQAVEDIQSRIREIMSELAKLRSQIPQDFVNPEALEQRDEGMDQIRDKIESGDLDAAMEALDQMLGQTERMLSQLQEGREELKTREYSEITERAEKAWKELQEVRERQRDLAGRTEQIAEDVRERSRERVGDAKDFIEEQLRRLKAAAGALEEARPKRHMPDAELFERAERRIADGRDALDSEDFGATQEVLDKALEQLAGLERDARRRLDQAERFGDVFGMGERATKTRRAVGQPRVRDVLEAIEELSPDPAELLDQGEKNQLDRFGQEQKALAEKAEQIGEQLEELGKQLPVVGPEVRAALDEAKSAMGQSGESLGQGDAPGAAGQERRAVEALERLANQLQEMGSQSGGGQGGAGVPLPFGQPSGVDPQNERGGQGRFNRDKVEIPKPEAFQAPTEFREDILDAAKQGTVEAYRDAVRRYYEELVK